VTGGTPPGRVLVVGAGLIGTSVALALRSAGVSVWLADRDPARRDLACALDAGVPWQEGLRVDHAVLAVPPGAVAEVLVALQKADAAATYSDCASVKLRPQVEVESVGAEVSSFCGAHPVAGRERPGAAGARSDLFVGRAWVVTPSPATSAQALGDAMGVATACGASVTVMPPDVHDQALARVSHVPQLVASLLAARLLDDHVGAAELAGQGLRDTTRIAASDPALWADIVASNAGPVAAVLDELARDLERLRAALPAGNGPQPVGGGDAAPDEVLAAVRGAVRDVVSRGNAGRARLPGKHGALGSSYTSVPVVVEDEPGTLARLFADCAASGVNVEDVHLEHAPGRARGVAEVLVAPAHAATLAERLAASGWRVHLPEQTDTV
jgi:prephenate dehydrogenase